MIEREDGAYFGILLHQIIDAHREAAECSRKLWNRIWIVLWVSVGVLAFGAWYSEAQAEPDAFPVTFSWSYPQPVPEHVVFELFVRACPDCDFESAGETRMLALSRQYDYADLQQGAYVVVHDALSGTEIARLTAHQTRIDERLLPALRECRMGGDCPGAGAMQRLLREDGKRDGEDRARPRVVQ